MKKTLLIVSSSVVLIMILLMFLIAGTGIIGIEPYRRTDGSIVYVKPTESNDIMLTDKIFFCLDDESKTATGTVRDINYSNKCFYIFASDIKFIDGYDILDKNQKIPIEFDSVYGKALFSIGGLGYVSEFITTDTGFTLALVVTLVFALLIAFSSFLPSSPKRRHKSRYVMQIPPKETGAYESFIANEDMPAEKKPDKNDQNK